jgi:hypothetical protein
MLRLVVLLKYSDVPEMLTASIIRAMSDLLDDGDRKTSERSVYFYETTQRNFPEGCHLHTRRREKLKCDLCLLGPYN